MTTLGTETAVVIAAGAGTRLRRTSANGDLLKPLTPVLGVPLVVRTLGTLRDRGVRRVVVVTGYRAEELTSLLLADARLDGLDLEFVLNPDWQRQNGLSVLSARGHVNGKPFFLSMADHLYSGRVLDALGRTLPPGADLALAVDRRVGEVLDLDDAVRVRVDGGGRITAIGKGLAPFDAVDTGVFLCTAALFRALSAELSERGDCSLSDGVRRLAAAGRARAVEVPEDAWWQDVDTLADLRLAESKVGVGDRVDAVAG